MHDPWLKHELCNCPGREQGVACAAMQYALLENITQARLRIDRETKCTPLSLPGSYCGFHFTDSLYRNCPVMRVQTNNYPAILSSSGPGCPPFATVIGLCVCFRKSPYMIQILCTYNYPLDFYPPLSAIRGFTSPNTGAPALSQWNIRSSAAGFHRGL
ncbi:hypothetical protein J6590_013289 [Homalodisca vitripennis]|nr:hypothetical protein J6590_013289 [Homalodisca vitripennis]